MHAQYIKTKDVRVTISTWNVAGQVPDEDLDIDDWISSEEPSDIYIFGCVRLCPHGEKFLGPPLYVRNRMYPEGCMDESYIVQEMVTFLEDCKGIEENDTVIDFKNACEPTSGTTIICPDSKLLQLAHLCMLENTDAMRPYFELLKNSWI